MKEAAGYCSDQAVVRKPETFKLAASAALPSDPSAGSATLSTTGLTEPAESSILVMACVDNTWAQSPVSNMMHTAAISTHEGLSSRT